MAGKLRIAIAGTGFGEKYAIGLKANPEVELVAVFSRRIERAAAMADRFDIPSYTRDFEDLLRIPYLDAVAVVTPNSTHAEFVHQAVRARKHVICDKPLALSGEEATQLYRAAEEAGVRHVTFVPYRFSPAAAAMKEATSARHAGRTISVSASWGVDMSGGPLRWRFQRRLSGAGVVADLGAHILDLLTWWAGPIRRVLGRCKTLVPERPLEAGGRMRPVDVPDECWALIEFAEAGIGSVKLSWNARRDQQIEIEGDRGRLIYESPSLLQWLEGKGPFAPTARLALAASPHPTELPMRSRDFASPETALAKMLGDAVSYLRGGEKPDCVATFREGAEVMRVIDAIEESNATGRWAELPPTT
ncbi:MAG: Gfo/Idh/MocA family protein [Armatimonadota bacterium]